jgi:hypothetical protein
VSEPTGERTSQTAPSGAVALTIDYSNGAKKSFTFIPWRPEMDVLEVLRAAGSIQPGVTLEFHTTLPSDRAGRARGFIASLDGIKADQTKHKWLVWINDTFVGNELATHGQFGAGTEVNHSDVILIKLVSGE